MEISDKTISILYKCFDWLNEQWPVVFGNYLNWDRSSRELLLIYREQLLMELKKVQPQLDLIMQSTDPFVQAKFHNFINHKTELDKILKRIPKDLNKNNPDTEYLTKFKQVSTILHKLDNDLFELRKS